MTGRYVYDVETDGFLEELTKIHSLVLYDLDEGKLLSYADQPGYPPIKEGVERLANADLIVGHNQIKFDIPAIQKVHPGWSTRATIRDTLVLARLIWPKDRIRVKDNSGWGKTKNKPLKQDVGAHTLKAFGYRLGFFKGDFNETTDWQEWSPEMQSYCENDVLVTVKLWERIQWSLEKEKWSEEAVELEHDVATIVARQERYGWFFDVEKAHKLYADLVQRQAEVERQLQEVFPPRYLKDGKTFTPKRDNKRMGYVEGAPLTKVRLTEFNPGSRDHIAIWLQRQLGWSPQEFTKDGKPKVDEDVLSTLPWPEAKVLNEYLMIGKRIGQLATGDKAWLKLVGPDGRIRGSVNTNGAVTRRMTHSNPNLAQVPANGVPYGEQCRELFTVPKGKKQVGCDADALELRCLAGYMARYDNGEYVKVVLEGKKEDKTDIHNVNARALGCDRDTAKTWFYAFIYGAGDQKLGWTLGVRGKLTVNKRTGELEDKKARKAGRESRDKFLKNLPALGTLVTRVKAKVAKQGYLKSLDGGRLVCRSQHSALNTLLQSAGAILMKRALVILDQDLQSQGLVPGEHYEFIGNIHDEWQIEVDEDLAEQVGQTARQAIVKSGQYYNFGCPLDGGYDIGNSWKETH